MISIVVVLFAKYTHLLIVYIDMLYTYVNVTLAPIFNNTDLGIMIRRVLTLVLLPVMISGIPALIYRLIKRQNMPYYIEITWIIWLIIVLSKILIQ
jgi:hypothetical protein